MLVDISKYVDIGGGFLISRSRYVLALVTFSLSLSIGARDYKTILLAKLFCIQNCFVFHCGVSDKQKEVVFSTLFLCMVMN